MSQEQIPESVYFSGRTFSVTEIQLIQQLTKDFAALSLTELARTVCELLQWKRPNGGLKDHECRLLLERLAERGLVRLPAVRRCGPKGPRRVSVSDRREPETELRGTAGEF